MTVFFGVTVFFLFKSHTRREENNVSFRDGKTKIQSEKNNVTVFSHRGYGVTVFCYQGTVFFSRAVSGRDGIFENNVT